MINDGVYLLFAEFGQLEERVLEKVLQNVIEASLLRIFGHKVIPVVKKTKNFLRSRIRPYLSKLSESA